MTRPNQASREASRQAFLRREERRRARAEAERAREEARKVRQISNSNTPFLKLPAELRNAIYDLALPNEQVYDTCGTDEFTVEGIEEGVKHTCKTIRTAKDYRRYFGITQVCRQVREETTKMAYKRNIFMLRVYNETDDDKKGTGRAEVWVKTRPRGSTPGLSRIILQQWFSRDYFAGMEMVLFEPTLKSTKIISRADIGTCETWDHYWFGSYRENEETCKRCFEDFDRTRDFKDVLEATMKAPLNKNQPGAKLLELIDRFRGKFPCPPQRPSGWDPVNPGQKIYYM